MITTKSNEGRKITEVVIYKSCHPLSGQQIGDTHHSIDAIFMRVLRDEKLVLINLPTWRWLITIRNDGICVNWDAVRGNPEFNHLLPGSRYCSPSSLSAARQLTRCPKFKQHAENMMENPRESKAPIISVSASSRLSTTSHIRAG